MGVTKGLAVACYKIDISLCINFLPFFPSLPPNGSKRSFFQSLTWQASRPYKISQKIGKLIKYTLSNPLCIWCNAIVFWISYSFHYFSNQYVRVQGVQISLLHSKTLSTLYSVVYFGYRRVFQGDGSPFPCIFGYIFRIWRQKFSSLSD